MGPHATGLMLRNLWRVQELPGACTPFANLTTLLAVYAEAGGSELRGTEQIRTYVERALARFTTLRFELLSITESEGRSAVEYRRHSNVDGDHPAHVLELIEWQGDRIVAVRVFHG